MSSSAEAIEALKQATELISALKANPVDIAVAPECLEQLTADKDSSTCLKLASLGVLRASDLDPTLL